MDAFAPYAPLNVLKSIGSDIWIVDGPEIRFRYWGLKIPFPTRMTVVKLPDGQLWLHSPTVPDQDLVLRLRELGTVRFLIAPNTLHYWWVPEWKAQFPDADVYAVAGLQRSAKRAVPVQHDLGEAVPPAWAETLDQVLVEGSILTEVDFFHRPSRTLILTDLIENFEPRRVRSRFWRWVMRWSGAADPDGKAPIDMQLSFLGRRRTLKRAVDTMLGWHPEGIVIAHGRWYDGNAEAELRRAFRWVL